jgi:NADH-quinone oxidoreductase subunit J
MNAAPFIILAVLTLSAALAAACLRKLIHAALCVALTFIGMAGFFFFLGAEFVGLVQIFVYVGAVAVLVVFTILLTRRDPHSRDPFRWSGALVALAVFVALLWAILKTPAAQVATPRPESLGIRQIGESLMTAYVWPLQAIGVILTAALIGALILVLEEKEDSHT